MDREAVAFDIIHSKAMLYSQKEAAGMLGITVRELTDNCIEGKMGYVVIGKRRKFLDKVTIIFL